MAKTDGPGTLAAEHTVVATASTLHGVAITSSTWTKKITIVDPCIASKVTYTVEKIADVEYQIGEADKTIMTASKQITQGGGDATKFCLTRIK